MIISGDQNIEVPNHVHFGKYMLSNLRRANANDICLENGLTRETLTYKEATHYAVSLSVGLTELGVKLGDVVAIGSEYFLHYVPTVLAVTFTGASYTAYELNIGRAVLKHKVQLVKPKYFICSVRFWQKFKDFLKSFDCIETYIAVSDIPELPYSLNCLLKTDADIESFEPKEVQGDIDTVLISYSSGTTGMPKGVEITHKSCIITCLPDAFREKSSLQTAFMLVPSGNIATFMTYKFLAIGRKVIFTTDFTQEKLQSILKNNKIDVIFSIPISIRQLALSVTPENDYFESVEMIYSRSSPLREHTIKHLQERLPNVKFIIQAMGTTECGEPMSEIWAPKPKPGSVGVVSPGTQVKIVDINTRAILGPNQQGEICVKGPMNLKSYIGIDHFDYLDEDGYYKTGDLGYFDEDHYFYIVDRLTHIINVDGYNVSPVEVENVLLQHPEVQDAGVVGKPGPTNVSTEYPMAFVVKKPGSHITEQQLIDFVASEVSPYMQLKGGLRFIEEIPRNERGKILRRQLKEM
ncbi:4-coumarate--CoA ligase 1-like isoform X1 [Leguminivora glycinivorella]|uniref:4-coumarate--CoA ligase 1-like isoform X1 n=1 Tax=Leguminivora glycinivorella TaxID=1035111 RepID=UPI00200F83C2|nr:4-coumarate--CoA ligase 1-like isoform X1 [Leguminivora glycinivorella]